MQVNLIIPEECYKLISSNLCLLDDPNEQFGFALAGTSNHTGGCNILLRKFIYADNSCLLHQSGAAVKPDPIFVKYIWKIAKLSNSSLIDFHTHPFADRNVQFSCIDDRSEMNSFPRAVEYLGKGPHASVVLGRNSLDARWYDPQAKIIKPISGIRIIGNKLVTITPTSVSHIRGKNKF